MSSPAEFSTQVIQAVEAAVADRFAHIDPMNSNLVEAMRYSFFSGGKRIRPRLVFAAARAVRVSNGEPIPETEPLPETLVASALELIHTYSLVHDDLPAMDDDDLRRGKPTCHKEYDEPTAILVGDALLNLAFQILLDGIEEFGSPLLQAAKAVGEASGAGGMVIGQALDLQAEGETPSSEEVRMIHENKTGAMIHACVVAGGHVAGANDEQAAALSRFGKSVGLAFQIVDDLLDLEKTTEQLGKTAGKDSKQNKSTYPAAFGVEESRRMAAELTSEAETALKVFPEGAEALSALADLILQRDH